MQCGITAVGCGRSNIKKIGKVLSSKLGVGSQTVSIWKKNASLGNALLNAREFLPRMGGVHRDKLQSSKTMRTETDERPNVEIVHVNTFRVAWMANHAAIIPL